MRIDRRRWGVFNLVGFGGFILQLSTVAALTRVFGCSAMLSTAMALEVAATHNFIGHSCWTWGYRRPQSVHGWLARFGRYQAAKATSLAGSFAAASFLVWHGVPPELGNMAAVLLCSIPNYLLAENYVFQDS